VQDSGTTVNHAMPLDVLQVQVLLLFLSVRQTLLWHRHRLEQTSSGQIAAAVRQGSRFTGRLEGVLQQIRGVL